MKEFRKLVRETLIAALVNEGALGFMDLEPSVGLVIGQNSTQIFINLFDFKTEKCVGTITLKKRSNRIWYVDTVAAEKGIGPLMYEIGMMAIYPAGIGVGGPTNEKAFDIFNKFEQGRGDIKKVIIKPSDEDYTSFYRNDDLQHYLENIIFSRTKSIWFNKLEDRGRNLMEKNNLDIDFINKKCQNYFLNKYNS